MPEEDRRITSKEKVATALSICGPGAAVAMLVFAVYGCSGKSLELQEMPPAELDCERWLEICRSAASETVLGIDPIPEATRDALTSLAMDRGTDSLIAQLRIGFLEDGRPSFNGQWVLKYGWMERSGERPVLVQGDEAAWCRAIVPVVTNNGPQDDSKRQALHLRYRNLEGEWLLSEVPTVLRLDNEVELAVVESVSIRMPLPPAVSPLLRLRRFGVADASERQRREYRDAGISLPAYGEIQDVTWADQIVWSSAESDLAPESGDTISSIDRLRDLALSTWYPQFEFELVSTQGRYLPINSVTLRVDKAVDSSLLFRVLHSLSGFENGVRRFRLEVLAISCDPAASVLWLDQPIGVGQGEASPTVVLEAGIEQMAAVLASQSGGRVGLLVPGDSSFEDVAQALGRLVLIGAGSVYVDSMAASMDSGAGD